MFPKHVYIQRRDALRQKVRQGIVLLLGNNESPVNYADNPYRYRQDSTFLYFIGIDVPGVDAVIDLDNQCDFIFGDDADMDTLVWMGHQPSMRERAESAGISHVRGSAELSGFIADCIRQGRPVHFNPPYRADNVMKLADLLSIHHRQVEKRTSLELTRACIDLRSIKAPFEVEEIERQMQTAYDMHVTAMRMAQPGMRECQVMAAVEAVALASGSMGSFPVICSVRGETLHNHHYNNVLKEGDLLLVDAGVETPLHYATDHTRTSPVGGCFSPMQRDIYQIVLNANHTAIQNIRPGVAYRDIHFMAAREMVVGLQQMGLMKGNVDDALASGAHALFFPHGLGHMMGLDVHDMEDYNDTLVGYDHEFERSTQFGLKSLRLARRLQPGFVVTVEPGLYFIPQLIEQWQSSGRCTDFINYDQLAPYIGFGGIRLEDDVLVTPDGNRLLGNRIPIEIDDVQRTVQSGR